MKKNFLLALAIIATLVLGACSNDDDGDNPNPNNNEGVITTFILTLTPEGGGTTITFTSRDADGDGPGAAELTIDGQLNANTAYTAGIVFLDESSDPGQNLTAEILQNATEYQVMYVPGTGLNITPVYLDGDGESNPLGLLMGFQTGAASVGTFTISLRNMPNKPNDGTLAGAGGTAEVESTFTGVIIQ